MNAKEAAEMSERNKDQRPQRAKVMQEIEKAAKKGWRQLIWDDNLSEGGYFLLKEDTLWLQEQGYRVGQFQTQTGHGHTIYW